MSSATISIASWPAGGLRRRAGLRAGKGGGDSRHATPSTAKQGGHVRTLGRVVAAVKTPHHIKISVTEPEVVPPSDGCHNAAMRLSIAAILCMLLIVPRSALA